VICWLSQRIELDHGAIGDPEDRPYGNGVLLWFEVDTSTRWSTAPLN
jgi:hypothetical protein